MQTLNGTRLASTVVFLLLALGGAATQAQPGVSAPPLPSARVSEEPRFKVELIVFRYEAGNPAEEDLEHGRLPADAPQRLQVPAIDLETVFGDAAEPFAAGEPAPEAPPDDDRPSDGLELLDSGPDRLSEDGFAIAGGIELPPDFRRLVPTELELGAARARLDRLDAYTVLAHTGWVQSGVDDPATPWIDLRYLGVTNPTGTIRIRRGRFFFVAFDIDMHDERDVYFGPGTSNELTPLMRGSSYHYEVERSAIREGELQYFDHPLFGVLVRITPVVEDNGDRPAA